MKSLTAITFIVALAAAAPPSLAASIVYVPMGGGGEVLVIDADSDTIVGRIAEVEAVHGLAGSPGGDYLVAGMYAEMDPGQPALPAKPEGMSEAEHQAHHEASGASPAMKSGALSLLSIISTKDRSVIRRIEVPGAVHHTAVTPDGRYAVATHPNGGGISVIDLSTYQVVATVQTGLLPNYTVFSADGKRAYVSNAGSDTISEIDTEHWTVRRSIVASGTPEHMVLSPDGATLYVANVDDGNVTAVSLAQGEVVETYGIGGMLHGIDLSDDGRTLYVSGRELNKLVAIDLDSGRLRSAILDSGPYHITAIPGTGKLYVSSAEEPKIWVVDQASLRTLGEIQIGGKGHQMVVVAR